VLEDETAIDEACLQQKTVRRERKREENQSLLY